MQGSLLRRSATRRAALALASATLAVVPATASASTAAVEPDPDIGATLVVDEGASPEINQITVAMTGRAYVVTDSAGITPGARCTRVNATTVSCDAGAGLGEVRNLAVSTLDGNDTVQIASTVTGLDVVWLAGGDGNDQLTGGPTDDVIDGGAGDDVLAGGAGDDLFVSYDSVAFADSAADSAPDGSDTMDGGAGAFDTVAYGELLPFDAGVEPLAREVNVTAVLRGATPTTGNGEPAENDVLVNVEDAHGGSGADLLDGGDAANFLAGGSGGDRLIGGSGDDELDGGEGRDTFAGGAGDDLVKMREDVDGRSGGVNNGADCGAGDDRIATGPADDLATIVGCEAVSPRIVSDPAISLSEALIVGHRTTVTNLRMTGTPQPTARIIWLSCTAQTSGCVTRAVGDSYVLQDADVGRYVRATVDALNGDPQILGLYAQSSTTTFGAGPVYAARAQVPAQPINPLGMIGRPPPIAGGAGLVTAADASARLLGGPVQFLANVGALSMYAPVKGTSSVRVRAGRTTKVLAIICLEATCDVTVDRELLLRPRRAAGATRRLKLTGRRVRLVRGQGTVVSLRLDRSQLSAARRAQTASLQVKVRTADSTHRTRSVTKAFRVRAG